MSCGWAVREEIAGRARLLVVPLGPRFRSVIPRNFSSEESALQLLRDREQSFPRRLPPARDYERRGSIGTAEAVPFPTLGNSRADTIRLRFVSGHAFIRAVRVGRFASCRGRRGEDITGGARLLVVPLWPHFRFVIPRNFSSEESALQLPLIENRAFLAGSRPLGTMREEDLSARVKLVPFPKSARM